KPGWAAKPDTGSLPIRHYFTQLLTGQKPVSTVDKYMQLHIGRSGIGSQFGQGLRCQFGCAVEQINDLSARTERELFHSGDKRRDANTPPDPDLASSRIVKCEGAIRTLDNGLVANLQCLGQQFSIVTQGFGDESDTGIACVPG